MSTQTQTEFAVQETFGERPPLLFVHGAWGGAWVFQDHFVPWFTERGWACHALDLRHHGERDGPKSLRRTRIKDYVDDVAAAVADLPRPPIIVGHSMGGLITQRYLEERNLPGAVLMASVPLGGVWRATGRFVRRHPLKFLQANLTLDLGRAMNTERVVRSMLLESGASADTVSGFLTRSRGESFLAYLDMMFVTRARPQLIQTPVAVIAAEQDRLFSVKEQRRLAGAYGVTPTVIPGSAHHVPAGPAWQRAAATVERAALGFLE